jgi:disulfide bond formation protein DsbB
MNRKNANQVAEQAIPEQSEVKADGGAWISLFLAWALAITATLGALFIGEVMGQTPCMMCWFQRAFMFPLAVILGVAAFRSDFEVWWYAIPLAGIGALLAFYHSLLYSGVIAETLSPCSQGVSCKGDNMVIFGLLPLPLLALGSFLGIVFLTYFAKRRTPS